MRTTLTLLLGGLLALSPPGVRAESAAGAPAPAAAPAGTQPGKNEGPRILQFREQIGLTDEQAQAIARIHQESHEKIRSNHIRILELRRELRKILEQGYVDRDVRRNAEEQGRLFGERVLMRSQRQSRIRDVLSEEQKIRLKSLVRERARRKRLQGPEG